MPPELPPCKSCRVELREDNEEAAEIYMTARRQYITAGDGQVVDISIQAVKTLMDLYGVRKQKECLLKIVRTFHHFNGEQADESGKLAGKGS
jgi:hypothetical protein